MGEKAVLSTTAAFLGEALVAQGRHDEALRWAELSAEQAPDDDMHTQSLWRVVHASVLSARGEPAEAERYAREAVAFAERTDDTNDDRGCPRGARRRARACAGTRRRRRPSSRAGSSYTSSKGNVVGADRVRAQLAPLARV